MKAIILEIKQWGNDLGVRLPAAIAREAHVHANQRVKLSVANGQIIITPVLNKSLTLAQRLARFDPTRHGGEALSANPQLGIEKWE